MTSSKPMVVGMKELITVHVVNNLEENYSFNDFAEDGNEPFLEEELLLPLCIVKETLTTE